MENKIYVCKFCGKVFTNANALGGHIRGCELNPDKNKIFKEFNCQFCGKVIKNNYSALLAHEKSCQDNPSNLELYSPYVYHSVCKRCNKPFIKIYETKKKYLDYLGHKRLPKYCGSSCANKHDVSEETKKKIREGVISFNEKKHDFNKLVYHKQVKNKKEYDKIKIEKIIPTLQTKLKCKYCKKEFLYKKGESFSRLYCSPECKHNFLSEHTGGYRKGSGCGKSGWYKGIHCDSSWELAFVVYHLDNNLKIERCKEYRKYVFNNEIHTYIPDFVTDNGIVEIKGYKNEVWEEKEKQNPDIKVLYKKDMESYITYAVQKYGLNFINLYDDSGIKKVPLDKKGVTWFHKINHENKTYINAFVKDNSEFNFYIENGWNVNRIPINAFKEYKDVRYKVERRILRKFKNKKDKEKYLSSLL